MGQRDSPDVQRGGGAGSTIPSWIADLCLEIPGGLLEAGDSPQEAAHHELFEETGYQEAEMLPLDYVYPDPAFLNNRIPSWPGT